MKNAHESRERPRTVRNLEERKEKARCHAFNNKIKGGEFCEFTAADAWNAAHLERKQASANKVRRNIEAM